MIKKKLPLIKLKINPEDGSYVQAISIVKDPAVMSSFISFSNNIQSNFSTNDERMELIGIAMRCNTPIYRNSPETGEYACEFDADTVREISMQFARNGFFSNMNINHTDKSAGSYVFQSYIVSTAQNILSPKGIDAKDGDWIIGVKVLDPNVWNDIKSGKDILTGFSIEGTFNFVNTDTTVSMYMNSQLSELDIALSELEELENLINNISTI
jgi:hypothetical protein